MRTSAAHKNGLAPAAHGSRFLHRYFRRHTRINIKMDVRPIMAELELMWRCLQCGHLWPNHSATLPENCSHCGAPKTEFELVRED